MNPRTLINAGFLGLLVAACGGPSRATQAEAHVAVVAPPGPDPVERGADDSHRETRGERAKRRHLEGTMRAVARARGLEPKRSVPLLVLDRSELIARVKAHVEREIPTTAIVHEGLMLTMLGFVPRGFDYAAETYRLLETQLAGFYEPEDGSMVTASDLDGENAEATLTHELVHALQDQHFDLKSHGRYSPGQSDRAGALSALAEGDATSAMADVMLQKLASERSALDLPESQFVAQLRASANFGDAAKAPHILRTSLVAPYIDGTLFVHALRRRGGWALVDRAWADLPKTTEQILHPEKWEHHELAVPVPTPPLGALGDSWEILEEDTVGEQGLRVAWGEWLDERSAA